MRLTKRMAVGALGLLLLVSGGCASKTLTPGEGYIPVTGGKVWYRIVGTGKGTPLLVLHGGPGVPSYYLNPLAALGDDRPVVFYDQLGCGRSDQPADTSLYTVQGYVERLGQVRKALGLDKVDIYGHSWGSMLAVDYMLTQPKGVEKLVLAGPALSIPRWVHDADSLLATLPDSLQEVIHRNEAAGTTDSAEYQNAVGAFYAQYLCRVQPWPADVDSSFERMGEPWSTTTWKVRASSPSPGPSSTTTAPRTWDGSISPPSSSWGSTTRPFPPPRSTTRAWCRGRSWR